MFYPAPNPIPRLTVFVALRCADALYASQKSYANADQIADYAAKQWGGLVSGYHLPLWTLFFNQMYNASHSGASAPPTDLVDQQLMALSETWTNSTAPVPGLSGEDTVAVASELYSKWAPLARGFK